MSSSPDINQKKLASLKPTKVVVPKVWKRPHSTIYGKNVEFGNKLYSDKLGEINGRKFNSELPWQVRNSGPGSTSGSSSSQGYLSNLLNEPQSTLIGSVITPSGRRDVSGATGSRYLSGCIGSSSMRDQDPDLLQDGTSLAALDKYCDRKSRLTPVSCSNYADVLELTNPNRYSKRRSEAAAQAAIRRRQLTTSPGTSEPRQKRIDFYDNYLEFSNEINRMNESSRLANDPLLQRRIFDKYLDFNYELGLFVPNYNSDSMNNSPSSRRMVFHDDGRSLLYKKTIQQPPPPETDRHAAAVHDTHHYCPHHHHHLDPQSHHYHVPEEDHPTNPTHSHSHFNPVVTTTKQTHLLPKHACQLADSPYGQSADGRKLSLGSINPHSYRPSLPQKTSTVHASDGEEFEFQDRSSPFYTDRWAGRTIRHFDSDLYSNASLFKSMIL